MAEAGRSHFPPHRPESCLLFWVCGNHSSHITTLTYMGAHGLWPSQPFILPKLKLDTTVPTFPLCVYQIPNQISNLLRCGSNPLRGCFFNFLSFPIPPSLPSYLTLTLLNIFQLHSEYLQESIRCVSLLLWLLTRPKTP